MSRVCGKSGPHGDFTAALRPTEGKLFPLGKENGISGLLGDLTFQLG